MSKGSLAVLTEMGIPVAEIVAKIKAAQKKHETAGGKAAVPLSREQVVEMAEHYAQQASLTGVRAWVVQQIVAEVSG